VIRDLIKIADRLDALGLNREADILDSILRKASAEEAGEEIDPEFGASIQYPDDSTELKFWRDPEIEEESLKRAFLSMLNMRGEYDFAHIKGIQFFNEKSPFPYYVVKYKVFTPDDIVNTDREDIMTFVTEGYAPGYSPEVVGASGKKYWLYSEF
jgi:hypothetical protein